MRLRYKRTVTGAKMAANAAAVASEMATSLPTGIPCIRPRDAVAKMEMGFTSTKASSKRGRVSGGTKTLDMKVSGKMPMNPPFNTALGVRSTSPKVVNTQDSPKQNATTNPRADAAPGSPASGRKPSAIPTSTITTPAIRYRTLSPSSDPINGADLGIGNDRNRSTTPLVKSVLSDTQE